MTPQIIAHRGASYLAPENTLTAFKKAMELGADGVEMDVQQTSDAGLVIHHDYMIDLHTDISGKIYDMTMGDLKTLDFGSWKDVLFKDEKVQVDRITGHGGLFKTKGVGQRILAAAINSPISVMETAGEGGAWGIALLAGYLVNNEEKLSLADYLDKKVFAGNTGVEIAPTAEDVAGFDKYIETYKAGLAIEKAAVENKK
mgnify:CR=1 FL=1